MTIILVVMVIWRYSKTSSLIEASNVVKYVSNNAEIISRQKPNQGDGLHDSIFQSVQKLHPYNTETPLPKEEEIKFYMEIEDFFKNRAISTLNDEQINQKLSNLNERRTSGVQSIVNTLRQPPTDGKQSFQNLFLVDYLNYRSRWDDNVNTEIRNLVLQDLSAIKDDVALAAMIGDRVDLLRNRAVSDWETALQLVNEIPGEILSKRAAAEVYLVATGSGIPSEIVTHEIRKIRPNFSPEIKGSP